MSTEKWSGPFVSAIRAKNLWFFKKFVKTYAFGEEISSKEYLGLGRNEV